MSDKNGGKQFWEGLKDAGKTIVFFAICIALFYPGMNYVYDLFHGEEKRKPKPGEAVSLLLLISILAVFTVFLYPFSLWLYGFAILCWIGVSLFFKFIGFLWGASSEEEETEYISTENSPSTHKQTIINTPVIPKLNPSIPKQANVNYEDSRTVGSIGGTLKPHENGISFAPNMGNRDIMFKYNEMDSVIATGGKLLIKMKSGENISFSFGVLAGRTATEWENFIFSYK
jgi:hypothetical protein